MKALEMAWETRGKPGRVMFHSDRKNAGISFYHHSVWECGRFPRLSGDETCLLKKNKSALLSFISNMVRSWLPSYVNWATLRKEICGVGSAHGKQVVAQKNPFVTSTVTPMSKNRLLLNIILTTTAAWRLPAEPWVIPALMCSLAGLMNVIPTDDVYLPVRPTRLRPLNQKSNVRLSWHSVHDKYQPVKSPGVLVSVVRYYING
ncbi:transposase, partial [Escherichia coli]|nr:transposase [Escherichia coli]EGN4481240.1 transposase [Escherichia coli]EHK8933802.1 transposase [Escherichia coli]EII7030804.1 transposase [Escherichia coli]EIP0595218.1 transposase [Escherichia coli]